MSYPHPKPLVCASKLNQPKALLLDWDNTIVDSMGVIFQCLNKTFAEFGKQQLTHEEFITNSRNMHQSLRESFPVIFGDTWQLARDVYYKYFLEIHLNEVKLLDGANETLETLRRKKLENDIFIAVVSNKTGQYLRDEVAHLGLNGYFDKVIGATDASKDKPHKEPLVLALEGVKLDSHQAYKDVWMVGDSRTDIEAAINLGCVPVLFGDVALPNELYEHNIHQIKCHKTFCKIFQ